MTRRYGKITKLTAMPPCWSCQRRFCVGLSMTQGTDRAAQINANPGGIRLLGTDKEKATLLGYVQSLTDHQLGLEGERLVMKRYATGGSKPVGNALVERIMNNPNQRACTIRITQAPSAKRSFEAAWMKGYARGTGSNTNVRIDPRFALEIPTVDPFTGNVRDTKMPVDMGLSHELVHAMHIVEGVMGDTGKDIPFQYQTSLKNGVCVYSRDAIYQEELNTMGLGVAAPGAIAIPVLAGDPNENLIRREHGEELRGAYKH